MKENLKKLLGELSEWAITVGPILAAIGIMKSEKSADGKTTFVPDNKFVSHAKAKIFGIGTDDEAIIAAIFGYSIFGKSKNANDASGETNNTPSDTLEKIEAGKKIFTWLTKLKKFQQDRFRLVLTKIISEFCEGEGEKAKKSAGMNYAVNFLNVLASLPTDEERTELCLALNIITDEPSLPEQAIEKIKKVDLKKEMKLTMDFMDKRIAEIKKKRGK